MEAQQSVGIDVSENTARFVDQGGVECIRDVSAVSEIAVPFKGDAFRVVYSVQCVNEIWVVHAFQKKSTQGIEMPKREVDLIRDRLKKLKEALR